MSLTKLWNGHRPTLQLPGITLKIKSIISYILIEIGTFLLFGNVKFRIKFVDQKIKFTLVFLNISSTGCPNQINFMHHCGKLSDAPEIVLL